MTPVDDWFERDQRERRWIALTEDGHVFGLTPAEEGELAALRLEFEPTPIKPEQGEAT